jgi:uncharacterized protein (DUF1697 family)
LILIALLRGVNVGGRRSIRMERLRTICESLGLRDVRTYVQSGNVVFRTDETDVRSLGSRLEESIQREFGFHSDVIVRTLCELKATERQNPFAERADVHPAKLLVTFVKQDLSDEARDAIRTLPVDLEEVFVNGREMYVYFPEGMGRSKWFAGFDKRIRVAGTGRNWNTVLRLIEFAESLDTVLAEASALAGIEPSGGLMARKSKDKGNKDTKPPKKQKGSK